MRASEIIVEVVHPTEGRIGQIPLTTSDYELQPLFNATGTWKVRLPSDEPMADVLRLPGSALMATHQEYGLILSGPMTKITESTTPEDPHGTVEFEGVCDNILLKDRVAYPEPSNVNPTTQTLSHDVRTGPVEQLLHDYVMANCGPFAPAERAIPNLSSLVREDDLSLVAPWPATGARGEVITKRLRFPKLGEALGEMAALAGLGFTVSRGPNGLDRRFITYAVRDLRGLIRFDAENRNVSGQKVTVSAPTATRVIVAGQGEMVDRKFLSVDSPESIASEGEWNRRIEQFMDQRNTNEDDELNNAGKDEIEKGGTTIVGVQIVPTEDSPMTFMRDWRVGDMVATTVHGQQVDAMVTGAVIRADSNGFRVGALLGDPTGFSYQTYVQRSLTQVERRISNLERNDSYAQTFQQVEAARAAQAESDIYKIMGVF